MDWMLMPLRKYAQFSGRSQRKEFWMWVLFVILVSIVASIIDRLLGFGRSDVVTGPTAVAASFQSRGPVQLIVALAFLIPNIAVAVRRLHDIDRTGWWLLAPLVPYVIGAGLLFGAAFRNASAGAPAFSSGLAGGLAAGGALMFVGMILAIVLLVFYCLDGTRGPNRFGPDPKGPDLATTFA